jgi:hypothetical protein
MKSFKTFMSTLVPNLKDLHTHVTTTEPTGSNITKMHDMVNDIAKADGTPRHDIYNTIIDNPRAFGKYKTAATL